MSKPMRLVKAGLKRIWAACRDACGVENAGYTREFRRAGVRL